MANKRILFVNAGLESGGGLTHIVLLLKEFKVEHQNADLLVFAEGPVAVAARKAGITVFVLNSPNRISLKMKHELAAFIISNHYNIVHTHGPRANMYLMLIRHKLLKEKIKWFVTVHSNPYLDFAHRGIIGKIFTRLNVMSLKKSDGIFAVSSVFADIIKNRIGVPSERIITIVNGLKFHDLVEPKNVHKDFNLLYVARLTPIKNHVLLLNAFREANIHNAHLYLAGDGELREKIEREIVKLDLDTKVTLMGYQSQNQLTNLYRKIDLSLLVSASESFPLVLLEAADSAVPALATSVGDVPLLIRNDVTGYVISPNNRLELVLTLKKAALAYQNGELSQMGLLFREFATTHFTILQQAQSVLDGYNKLIKEG